DMPILLDAFAALDADARETDWDDDTVDWSRFDLALLRSPWDYVARHAGFMAWAQRTAAATRLLNPLDVVRWNTDKHYLAELAAAGVATVPCRFAEPGDDAGAVLRDFLGQQPHAAEIVVKPAIGAGSRDAQRHRRDDHEAAR